MTIDMQTCMNLSNAVYGGPNADILNTMNDWKQIDLNGDGIIDSNDYERNAVTGFVGAAYRRQTGVDADGDPTYDIVISYRGTERQGMGDYTGILPISAEDLANDLAIVSGFLPTQYNDAWAFYESIKNNPLYLNSNITITGHSLGGGLAQLVAAKALEEYGIQHNTYTFNAPGVEALLGAIGCDNTDYSFIKNYSAMNDWCGMFRQHIGDLYTIQPIPLEYDSNLLTQIFNLFTNSHEGILNYNEADFGTITTKPTGFNQKEGLSLWYYDANNILRNVADWASALPPGLAPMLTGLLTNIIMQVSTADLKSAIDKINTTIGAPLHVLHYSTPSGDYILDTAGGNSTIASSLADTVWGNEGSDTISTMEGNDLVYGDGQTTPTTTSLSTPCNDVIHAGAGNDTIYGGQGADSIHGGIGNDLIYGDSEIINENIDGNDYLMGGDGNDTVYGGFGDDTINGGFGDDLLYGGDGNDLIMGNGGFDTIYGGDGNDTITDDSGTDTIVFGEGITLNNIHISTSGSNKIITYGTSDSILLINQVNTNAIDDIKFADGTIYTISDTAFDHVITGTDGNDSLVSDANYGTVIGNAGNDTISTTVSGVHTYIDSSGNDTYLVNSGVGKVYIKDSSGTDTIVFGPGITKTLKKCA